MVSLGTGTAVTARGSLQVVIVCSQKYPAVLIYISTNSIDFSRKGGIYVFGCTDHT